MNAALPAFSACGIELEHMIVDRHTLSVLPVADELLCKLGGEDTCETRHGAPAWSNELVLHLLELKNTDPEADMALLSVSFQQEVQRINRLLEPMGARLMPTAMHPWMNPRVETRLWQHHSAMIYRAYDRIFDCGCHGWGNLQSMQLNLPFSSDEEFARLHAAIRLLLPILPALAASSPIAEGCRAGFMDFRMESYRTHQMRVPSTIGQVIPDTISDRAAYETQVLAPMYREIAQLDAEGILQHEWLNARGAIPRFDRNAIEIRVIDMQECTQANLAIAAAVTNAVHALYDETYAPLAEQQAIGTDALAGILHASMRDAERAVVADAEYLRLLGYPDGRCEAHELWHHLLSSIRKGLPEQWDLQEALHIILEQGTLAHRILRALGHDFSRDRLQTVYRELCDCLDEGRMFRGGR